MNRRSMLFNIFFIIYTEDALYSDNETAFELRVEIISNAVYYFLGAIESKENVYNTELKPKVQ